MGDQFDQVNDWLLSELRVGQIYLLAGTGLTDMTKATESSNTTAAQDQVNRNTVAYAPS